MGRDERRAARAVLVDESDAVLLLSGRDPLVADADEFWITPGGGLHVGETDDDAARREVFEETGAVLGALGSVVFEREVAFDFAGRHFRQRESFFAVRVARFEVRPARLTALEVRATTGWRWWPLDELSTTGVAVHPPELATVVTAWLASPAGAAPFAGT